MRIEAVLFDLDGTLMDHDGAAEAAVLAGAAAELPGRELDRDGLLQFWRELEQREYDRYLAGELTVQQQRRVRALGLARHLGLGEWSDERADAWFAGYLRRYRRSWRAFPEVPRVIRELGAGRQLGVITDGEGDIQRDKLRTVGLGVLAPHTTASAEAGCAKPDPAIFHLACRTLGVAPGRTAYVGDRLDVDAQAATEAGLLGIWLEREPTGVAVEVPRVRTLAEVAPLLD
ncbi:haloacid dehalogenase [Kitasatospora griseola]|uniref:Haloacid dehalogenase n=1 Tax=Kitasatospora griseola TaxID=2064 RepID=A0A0D0NEV4_KITGR|nr:HAD family hydrolase [Kitasatospora griseola]KIQ66810.1 haloacid dehalogenase [Kitasatospora griseola]